MGAGRQTHRDNTTAEHLNAGSMTQGVGTDADADAVMSTSGLLFDWCDPLLAEFSFPWTTRTVRAHTHMCTHTTTYAHTFAHSH